MKFRRKPRETVDINLASLIDVVFILLLFFVVTTTFTRETQLRVDLPESVSGAPTEDQNTKLLDIAISADCVQPRAATPTCRCRSVLTARPSTSS